MDSIVTAEYAWVASATTRWWAHRLLNWPLLRYEQGLFWADHHQLRKTFKRP